MRVFAEGHASRNQLSDCCGRLSEGAILASKGDEFREFVIFAKMKERGYNSLEQLDPCWAGYGRGMG